MTADDASSSMPESHELESRAKATPVKKLRRRAGGDEGRPPPGPANNSVKLALSLDRLLISENGAVMVIGWIDDSADPVEHVRLEGNGWRHAFGADDLTRVRRVDVEAQGGPQHPTSSRAPLS